MEKKKPLVAIIMGSNSDWPIMKHTADILDEFKIAFEAKVISAHLPGMVASKTIVPVLGVPIPTKHLEGQDSLLSIVQMPKGVPVATFAIGEAGAVNAGLFAASVIAKDDLKVKDKLTEYRKKQVAKVTNMKLEAD